MPRPHRQIAEEYGLSLEQVKRLSAKGVNVYDDAEIKAAKDALQKRPGQKVEPTGGLGVHEKIDIDQLESDLAKAPDLDTTRVVKEKLLGANLAVKIRKELSQLIPLIEVDERDVKNAAAVKMSLLKMKSDMPPVLEGLSAIDIRAKLTDYINELLGDLEDAQSEFWKDKEL